MVETVTIEKIRPLFWERVKITKDCWEWVGHIKKDGHGQLMINLKSFSAHRLAWLLLRGDIPGGSCICHKCDNPKCVNPDHLYLGSKASNLQDMWDRNERSMKPQKGSLNNYAKLKEDDIKYIRQSLREARRGKGRFLAKLFNVHEATISYIKNNKTWTHVEV